MNLQKHKPYRNRQLLDLAHRVQECQIQLDGCPGFVEDGCEPVHSDQQIHGKGMRQKADDHQHAAGCYYCHALENRGRIRINGKQSAPMFLHRADLAPLAKKTEGPSLRGNYMTEQSKLIQLVGELVCG